MVSFCPSIQSMLYSLRDYVHWKLLEISFVSFGKYTLVIYFFYPQTYIGSEEINMNLVHSLHIFHGKTPAEWNILLEHIEHAYNRVVHTSIRRIPFSI